jgi:hypothetical protein
MELSFLTPLGALFVLAALIPLAVMRRGERRLAGIRRTLGLREPSRRSRVGVLAAVVGVCALLALAATQPVVATTRSVPERTDAQIFAVVDISRSMLASADGESPNRFERARDLALRLRDEIPEVPLGVASMTDRLLPHLFPTTNRRVVAETLEDSIAVEQPPARFGATVATTLDALVAAPKLAYFPPAAKKRVLVVFTDGESRPLQEDLARAFRLRIPIHTVFVHVWDGSERIYNREIAEVGYAPDTGSRAALDRVAAAVRGKVFVEGDVGEVAGDIRSFLGSGPTVDKEHEGSRRPLMPYVALAAAFPLGFVLYRRNL